MKKKSVNLITAVGVLVVLSGAYVGVKAYVAKQDAAESESAEKENSEIVSIASADVKSIKFVIDKKEVTFEKDEDSWVKSDETDFPVDQDKIDTLVSSLNSITAERTLKDVEDASEYELDQPENTITVTTEDGETTVIRLGMENDATSQEYIDLNKDSSTVYVVSNSTFSSFEGSLYDFAKSGTFPTVDSSTVSKISVDAKSSSYVVEKDENNFWNITGDGDTEKADSAKATTLSTALSSMAYSSYVNYNCSDDQLSQYGLDKPYAEITVDYQEEVEKESTDTENEAKNGAEDVSETSEDESQADENTDNIFDRKDEPEDKRPQNAATDITETEMEAIAQQNHTCDGITVSGIDLPWYVQFRVSGGDDYQFTNEEDAAIFKSYEFELWDTQKNTEYKIPDGEYISVTVPVKAGYTYSIEHLLDNGAMETIIPSVDGDTMTFSTHSFSPFGIAGSKSLVGPDAGSDSSVTVTPAADTSSSDTGASSSVDTSSDSSESTDEMDTSQDLSSGTAELTDSSSQNDTESSESEDQSSQAKSKKQVNTGDTTQILPFVILFVAAAVVAGVVVFLKKRKK